MKEKEKDKWNNWKRKATSEEGSDDVRGEEKKKRE